MKYSIIWNKRLVPEWKEYYINYKLLKDILAKTKSKQLKTILEMENMTITNLSKEEEKYLEKIKKIFENTLIMEVKKFNDFFKFTFNHSIKIKLLQIIWNLKAVKISNLNKKKKIILNYKIKAATQKYYKEIIYFLRYISVNYKTIYKITKKYKKIFKLFKMYNQNFIINFNQQTLNSFVMKNSDLVNKLKKQIEEIFLKNYFPNNERLGIRELNKIENNNQFTLSESFKLGLFLGIFIFSFLIMIIVLVSSNIFKSNQNNNFIEFQFRVFRGSLILYLYLLFLGLNVYGWEKYNINYKRVFDIQVHYSTAYQILRRSIGFLSVWIILFLYTAFSNEIGNLTSDSSLKNIFSSKIALYLPPFSYFIFIFYIFFPSKKYFNAKGRIFFFTLCKDVILSPCINFEFITSFCSDQALSFIIILSDFVYSFCYFVSVIKNNKMENSCNENLKIVTLMIIILPIIFRALQEANKFFRAKDKAHKREKLLNFFKYLISLISSILSFFAGIYDFLIYVWLTVAIINTIYAYSWDIKVDWGFLSKNTYHKFLRSNLSYPNISFYYISILVNLILRLGWTVTLAPNLVDKLVLNHLVTFIIAILETYRRTLWNYFRVEREHLKYKGDFSAIGKFELPYKFNYDSSEPALKKTMQDIFELLLNKKRTNKNKEFLINKGFSIKNINIKIDEYNPEKNKNIINQKFHNASYDESDFINAMKKYKNDIKDVKKNIKKNNLFIIGSKKNYRIVKKNEKFKNISIEDNEIEMINLDKFKTNQNNKNQKIKSNEDLIIKENEDEIIQKKNNLRIDFENKQIIKEIKNEMIKNKNNLFININNIISSDDKNEIKKKNAK